MRGTRSVPPSRAPPGGAGTAGWRRRWLPALGAGGSEARGAHLWLALGALLALGSAGQVGGADARKWRILHVTDVHLDLQFTEGAEVHCDERPCCRAAATREGRTTFPDQESKNKDGTVLTFAAVTTATVLNPARAFGEYMCDTPLALLQSALDAARQGAPDLVVWGGDTAPHLLTAQQLHGSSSLPEDVARHQKAIHESLAAATQLFKTMFPNTPVFPSLGNHDFGPLGSGAMAEGWLTAAAAELWSGWLPPEAQATLRWGGYYQLQAAEGLRVVVLNTEVCHVHSLHAFVDGGVAARSMLLWLESVLVEARARRESVLLSGHIPPGVWSGCWGNYSGEYERLLGEHRHLIAGQLFGHHHSGSFRMMRSPSTPTTVAYGVAYVTPSLSPYVNQNPSFRFYDLAGTPGSGLQVSNLEQYYLKLGEADAAGDGGPLMWSPGFVPKAVLSIPDLSPNSWQGVLNKLWANETYAKAFRATESNGREWMSIVGAKNGELRDYLCALTGVSDPEYIKCAGKSEETMIRQYTGSQHTYVLTALFPFHAIMGHFSPVMHGILPEDWNGEAP